MKPVLTVFVCFGLCFCSHNKYTSRSAVDRGAVALTFDDNAVDNWYQHLPLFDSLKIKATFYVSAYHALSEQQKARLRSISAQGHEIAFHTTHHPDMVKMLELKGWAYLYREEIKKDLELMRSNGFSINNFSYPYGRHNQYLDDRLLKSFNSVRVLSNRQNYDKSLVKRSGPGRVLHAADIDMSSYLSDAELIHLLNKAQTHQDCLMLVAHQINNPNVKWQISAARLTTLARQAHSKGLRFVTVNEICY